MFTKLKLAMLIATPLVAGAATYAIAGNNSGADHQPPAELVQKFDKNGDGKLDDAERGDMKAAFAAKRAEHKKEMLTKYDTNKDGKLDDAERQVMRNDKLTVRFKAMDANGDGKLTLDEFKAAAPERAFHRHGRHGHRGHARTHNPASTQANPQSK
jgi:Ca2+-binding EF-hand superfamily protein